MRKSAFDHYKQMDSQEFILELLDVLHEDVNSRGHLKVTGSPNVTSSTPDHMAAQMWYDHFKKNNQSVFYELFHVSNTDRVVPILTLIRWQNKPSLI